MIDTWVLAPTPIIRPADRTAAALLVKQALYVIQRQAVVLLEGRLPLTIRIGSIRSPRARPLLLGIAGVCLSLLLPAFCYFNHYLRFFFLDARAAFFLALAFTLCLARASSTFSSCKAWLYGITVIGMWFLRQ